MWTERIYNKVHKEEFEAWLGALCFRKGSLPLYKDEDTLAVHIILDNDSEIHTKRYKNTRKVSISGHSEDIDSLVKEIHLVIPTFNDYIAKEKGVNCAHDGDAASGSWNTRNRLISISMKNRVIIFLGNWKF